MQITKKSYDETQVENSRKKRNNLETHMCAEHKKSFLSEARRKRRETQYEQAPLFTALSNSIRLNRNSPINISFGFSSAFFANDNKLLYTWKSSKLLHDALELRPNHVIKHTMTAAMMTTKSKWNELLNKIEFSKGDCQFEINEK